MTLKLIIDTDQVIERMALQDIDEVRMAVDSTLTAAHAVVQGILHTTFEPVVRTDLFYIDANKYPASADQLLCCRLVQAFTWPSVTIAANISSRKELITDPQPVASEDFILDPVRGYVFIDAGYRGSWVQITYHAGFDIEHKAPNWLQEAVLAYLPHLLSHPSGASDAATMNAATEAQRMAFNVTGKICEPYMRNRAFQFNAYGT